MYWWLRATCGFPTHWAPNHQSREDLLVAPSLLPLGFEVFTQRRGHCATNGVAGGRGWRSREAETRVSTSHTSFLHLFSGNHPGAEGDFTNNVLRFLRLSVPGSRFPNLPNRRPSSIPLDKGRRPSPTTSHSCRVSIHQSPVLLNSHPDTTGGHTHYEPLSEAVVAPYTSSPPTSADDSSTVDTGTALGTGPAPVGGTGDLPSRRRPPLL